MAMSRRKLMVGSAAVSLAAIVGGAMYIGRDRRAFLRRNLELSVGKFEMPEDQFTALQTDLEERLIFRLGTRSGLKWDLARMVNRFGMLDLLASFSPTVQDRVEIYRREAVTLFLLSTDFVEVSAEAKIPEVTYLGRDAGCRNPFAEFDA